MKKKQIYIGFAILIAMIVFGAMQYAKDYRLALHLTIGLTIGYVMQRSRFGFAGAIRKTYSTGDSSLAKALMFLFSISLIVTAAIHYGAAINGADVYFRAVKSGADVIPGSDYVEPANLATVLGGILFGIGMMLGGGCASGTLTDAGEGEGRALIVLFFFSTGALWGAHDMPWWRQSIFFRIHKRLYLPDIFGYMGAIAVSLLGYLLIYILVKKYEDKRRKENTLKLEEYADWEKELPEPSEFKFFSKETYHKFFVKRWSYYTGAVMIMLMFVAILVTTGTSWGVTAVYAHWAAWFYQALGLVDVSNWGWFAGKMDAVRAGFFNHPGSMRNMGIMIGALIAPLLAGHFSFKTNFKLRDVLFYAIGGLMMGYGARIALGCNIGALYSGLTNMSLSGWVFMPALTLGGILGVKLTRKLNVKI
ncbi:putative inner membrane protein [Clostridium tepidiprofundi DSM 19306]|uniref:Putative inner membrane protein n=1 Tax=Clostridium tepidiprofundi DSM 19306 TaxID=1121338 RepID=A0A151B3S9_9CLOT|nr:YeeE/YedE family protein [Clostridium tepidiprofundi]KYH34571.1 putative inner membrane protein [Clostridium tepidiprofundi DSM 19306]